MAKIIAEISKDGSKTTIRVEGVAGAGCEKLTASLEEALGEVQQKDYSDEFYLIDSTCIDCQQ